MPIDDQPGPISQRRRSVQDLKRREMSDLAAVACAALGTGAGTALLVGAPMYAAAMIEEREHWVPGAHHPPGHIDAIGIGALGFALGWYAVERSARRIYRRIYG